MFPFIERLILFLIAISVIRSVIRFVQGMMGGRLSQNRSPMNRSDGTQGTTMLQQDPVCGTYVAIDASLKTIVNGKVVHFCSAECRDKYRAA
jgi:YHS domain-containing protein